MQLAANLKSCVENGRRIRGKLEEKNELDLEGLKKKRKTECWRGGGKEYWDMRGLLIVSTG